MGCFFVWDVRGRGKKFVQDIIGDTTIKYSRLRLCLICFPVGAFFFVVFKIERRNVPHGRGDDKLESQPSVSKTIDFPIQG